MISAIHFNDKLGPLSTVGVGPWRFKFEEVFDEVIGARSDIDTEVDDSATQEE